MRNALFLFVLIYSFADAQNKRFSYEYAYVPDSTNKSGVLKEMLVLDVNPRGSEFYSYERFRADSLQAAEVKRQANSNSETISVEQTYKGKVFYTVSKEYPTFKVFLHSGLGIDHYKVSDDRKMTWKIFPEKQKIGEFEAQKAETTFFGRKWIAWFSAEIPIQDGPYKFHGLPGLIVKIEDAKASHSFLLKGISNYVKSDASEIEKTLHFGKDIPVNYAQYKRLFLEEFNDPTKSLRKLMLEAGTNLKMFGPDGVEVKPADIIRQRELKAKEDRKKNNNPLELDLLN